eukprot:COSAG01_NODE_7444_length_3207_cov_16.815756_4_plen_176_part_00
MHAPAELLEETRTNSQLPAPSKPVRRRRQSLPPRSAEIMPAMSSNGEYLPGTSGCLIEAPWLVNGGHGASLRQPLGCAAAAACGCQQPPPRASSTGAAQLITHCLCGGSSLRSGSSSREARNIGTPCFATLASNPDVPALGWRESQGRGASVCHDKRTEDEIDRNVRESQSLLRL